MKMQEEFLHFVWKFSLFEMKNLFTSDGEEIILIGKGLHNTDSGPDFLNARVRIDQTLWAGNIEIHLKSSDWYRHNHHLDKAYNNVILHVVYEHDKKVHLQNGELLPTLELKNEIAPVLIYKYQKLLNSKSWISCENQIENIDPMILRSMFDRLLVERLQNKTLRIKKVLEKNKFNWTQTFFIFLSRNFGQKINTLPFEMLARSVPFKILLKHRDSVFQLEALLFGQAGLLNKRFNENFPNELKKEYLFLRGKYRLKPIPEHLWKFMRLRPSSFPTLRISQLANLVHNSGNLFSIVLEEKKYSIIQGLFRAQASPYWECHYIFERKSKRKKKNMGKKTVENIIINTVVPTLYLYGELKNDVYFKQKAVNLLTQTPPERNKILRRWSQLGVEAGSAWESQALIQMKKGYCDQKRCLSCSVGNKLVRSGIDTKNKIR